MKNRVSTLVIIFLIQIQSAFAFHTDSPYRQAGDAYDISPYLLYAVSIIETRRYSIEGRAMIQPWPWTMNVNGESLFFDSKQELHQRLKQELDQGNDDLGLGAMQIHLSYHRHLDPYQLLDVNNNIHEGAKILRSCLDRYQKDPEIAVGCYNAKTESKRRAYAKKVFHVAGRVLAYFSSVRGE